MQHRQINAQTNKSVDKLNGNGNGNRHRNANLKV